MEEKKGGEERDLCFLVTQNLQDHLTLYKK
jgi:hypothetical protein